MLFECPAYLLYVQIFRSMCIHHESTTCSPRERLCSSAVLLVAVPLQEKHLPSIITGSTWATQIKSQPSITSNTSMLGATTVDLSHLRMYNRLASHWLWDVSSLPPVFTYTRHLFIYLLTILLFYQTWTTL